MSFFEKKYEIRGWTGNYSMTAKQLYERVLEDSKSNYNWIASASELVRICEDVDFPVEYAQFIKSAILNCCADLETQKEYEHIGSIRSIDEEAVYFCYNSLTDFDEKSRQVKKKYLHAVITAITKYNHSEVRFCMHPGPAYREVCKDWIKTKFNENVSREEIDFDKLREDLYLDFDKTIQKAEKDGVFEEDDKENRERIRKLHISISKKIQDSIK